MNYVRKKTTEGQECEWKEWAYESNVTNINDHKKNIKKKNNLHLQE